MCRPMAILISFISIVTMACCFAMDRPSKLAPVRVICDINGKPILSLNRDQIKIERTASPSSPLEWCYVIKQAMEHARRPASPLLTPQVSSPVYFEHPLRSNTPIVSNAPIDRPKTPWELNFGEALLPVLKAVESEQLLQKREKSTPSKISHENSLANRWGNALSVLGDDLSNMKRITRLSITANTVNSTNVVSGLVTSILLCGWPTPRFHIDYVEETVEGNK